MKTSFKILTVLGIDIELHVLFVALIASFLILDPRLGLLWILAFFFVTLHELCHAIVAKRNRIGVRRIILWPIGGMAVMDTIDIPPGVELRMALAGPLFNLILAVGIYSAITAAGYPLAAWGGQIISGKITLDLPQLLLFYTFYINLALGLFNLLLPAFPLDGGRILRAILAMRMDYLRATRYSQMTGLFIALGLFFFGLIGGDLWLMIIAFFIGLAGGGEYQATLVHRSLKRIPLSHVLSRDFATVKPSETVGRVARKMMAEKKSAVIVEATPFLVFDLNDLASAKPDGRVGKAAKNAGSITPKSRSEEAYKKLVATNSLALPVVSRRRLVGAVYRADFEKLIRLLPAVRQNK
ncbi:site-2 protease family protein [archaeon]|nr:site-2 protease family protein [archaeon]